MISCFLSQCFFFFADTLPVTLRFSYTAPNFTASSPLFHPLPPWTFCLLCLKCDPQARLPTSYPWVDVCFVLVELKRVPVSSSFHVDALFKLLNCWHAVPGSCYAWTPPHLPQALIIHARPSYWILSSLSSGSEVRLSLEWMISPHSSGFDTQFWSFLPSTFSLLKPLIWSTLCKDALLSLLEFWQPTIDFLMHGYSFYPS